MLTIRDLDPTNTKYKATVSLTFFEVSCSMSIIKVMGTVMASPTLYTIEKK